MDGIRRLSEVGNPSIKDLENINRDFTLFFNIKNKGMVDFLFNARLSLEEKGLLACLLDLGNTKISKDGLLDRIGVRNIEFFQVAFELEKHGYVKINDFGRTELDLFYMVDISSIPEGRATYEI